MTSSSLGYSEIEPFTNNNNRTRRAKPPPPRREGFSNRKSKKNVEALIDKIHNVESMESQLDSDEEGLANFNPPPPAESSGVTRMEERRNSKKEKENDDMQLNFLNDDYTNNFNYNIDPPFEESEEERKPKSNKKEDIVDVKLLMEKLNYVINMLEDQQLEKANTFTEEVVLYCFLGVFIIYVIDSFAKVGKYVR